MAHCPSCISFKEECDPEFEDYDKPCEYYENRWNCEAKGGESMKELKQEGGVTRISLDNLALLAPLHGRVRFILHYAPAGNTAEDKTLIAFQDGYCHTATGFACGYGGEGPHGLLTAIETYLKRNDITIEHICTWRGNRYLVLPGKGKGEQIFFLAGCEIW